MQCNRFIFVSSPYFREISTTHAMGTWQRQLVFHIVSYDDQQTTLLLQAEYLSRSFDNLVF